MKQQIYIKKEVIWLFSKLFVTHNNLLKPQQPVAMWYEFGPFDLISLTASRSSAFNSFSLVAHIAPWWSLPVLFCSHLGAQWQHAMETGLIPLHSTFSNVLPHSSGSLKSIRKFYLTQHPVLLPDTQKFLKLKKICQRSCQQPFYNIDDLLI